MSTILKILLARRFCLIVIGLLTMMTISAQSVPDITLTQALKLDHHGNPFKVLEKSNVEKIDYQEQNDSLSFLCCFGRNVEWNVVGVNMRITAPDAAGVCFNDCGSGGWEILTDHKEWLSYYLTEAKKLKFYPVDTSVLYSSLCEIQKFPEVLWKDLIDYDTGKVLGRETTLMQFDKNLPTGRILTIYDTDENLSLSLGWEFD